MSIKIDKCLSYNLYFPSLNFICCFLYIHLYYNSINISFFPRVAALLTPLSGGTGAHESGGNRCQRTATQPNGGMLLQVLREFGGTNWRNAGVLRGWVARAIERKFRVLVLGGCRGNADTENKAAVQVGVRKRYLADIGKAGWWGSAGFSRF